MAGNLLDALKHAGLADAKKAKKIENEKKQQQHRDLKRDAAHTQASSVPQPNTDHDFIAIEGKATNAGKAHIDRAHDAADGATNAQDLRDAARHNAEAHVADRLKQIYAQAALRNVFGRKKFYFETSDHFIECIGLSDVAYALIDRGKYAIVANDAMDDFIVVNRATALNLEAVDKRRVAVLKRQES